MTTHPILQIQKWNLETSKSLHNNAKQICTHVALSLKWMFSPTSQLPFWLQNNKEGPWPQLGITTLKIIIDPIFSTWDITNLQSISLLQGTAFYGLRWVWLQIILPDSPLALFNLIHRTLHIFFVLFFAWIGFILALLPSVQLGTASAFLDFPLRNHLSQAFSSFLMVNKHLLNRLFGRRALNLKWINSCHYILGVHNPKARSQAGMLLQYSVLRVLQSCGKREDWPCSAIPGELPKVGCLQAGLWR